MSYLRKNNSTSALNNSYANKYGLSIKQNTSAGSMGLNPNLNIQDQYIQNLLKQIHLMNMEIKLMKQKQKQRGGNALWGIVNRTGAPMVNNIVQSTQKYQVMRNQQDSIVSKLQKDNARLQTDQGALQNQLQYLQSKKSQLKNKKYGWKNQCQGKQQMLNQKISNHSRKLNSILVQLQKQQKQNKQLTQQINRNIQNQQIQRAKSQKQNIQIKNDQIIQQMMLNDLIKQIQRIKTQTQNLQKKFQEDTQYIQVSQKSKGLKQKATNIQKLIASANFQIMQLNQSLKMAQLDKQRQVIQRKRITQEYQQKKSLLNQIIALNLMRKIKQANDRKANSVDINRASQQTSKYQKRLQQIKKKLIKNQQTNCTLKNQVNHYQRQIDQLKQKNQKLNQLLNNYKTTNAQCENQILKTKTQIGAKQQGYQKCLRQQSNVYLDLFQLQRQLQYLRGRKQNLAKTIQMSDVLNGLNIQELNKMVQKNNDVNSTVATLMSKWDQIKNFSRI